MEHGLLSAPQPTRAAEQGLAHGEREVEQDLRVERRCEEEHARDADEGGEGA